MKNTLFFVLLLAGKPLLAQPLQTLTYENGKKYLQGHWTFTKPGLVPRMWGLENREGSQERPARFFKFPEKQPDANEAYIATIPNVLGVTAAWLLHITPADGPLTYWPTYGDAYLTLTYKGGVPNGPITEYYGPGKLLQSGNVVNGMPDGPWTYNYQSGKPYYTGAYKAYSQAQLEGLWNRDYKLLAGGREVATDPLHNGGLVKALRLEPEVENFMALHRVLLVGTRKEGPFTFYKKDGTVLAQIEYSHNLPAGTWKMWQGTRPEPTMVIEWKEGQVAAITNREGIRRDPVAQEAAKVAAEKARRQSVYSEYKYPEVGDASRANTSITEADPKAPKPLIFTYVEQMPQFEGNMSAWLDSNMRYPPRAIADGVDGRVVVKVVVQENGTLKDAVVDKGVRADLDAEALRLINALPAFAPGKQNGKTVKVYFRIPVKFSLP